MSERKEKRNDNLIEVDMDESRFVLEPANVEIGSGYALKVDYDESQKPIINVKTYGKVDIRSLAKEILRAFPDCQIRKVNNQPAVTVIKTRPKGKRKKK